MSRFQAPSLSVISAPGSRTFGFGVGSGSGIGSSFGSLTYINTAFLTKRVVFKSNVEYDSENPKYITINNSLNDTRNEVSLNKIKELVDAQLEEYTGIVAGDKIILSTTKGEKYVTYVHNNISYNVLSAIKPSGEWVYLTQGLNYLVINKDGDIEITASVKNKIYYYGV